VLGGDRVATRIAVYQRGGSGLRMEIDTEENDAETALSGLIRAMTHTLDEVVTSVVKPARDEGQARCNDS
jgi:hypothetical protein